MGKLWGIWTTGRVSSGNGCDLLRSLFKWSKTIVKFDANIFIDYVVF